MADMWDWLVPNISGQTNEKVAGARAQNAGPNGRLDPNAITRETLSGYGIPSDVTDEAAPYLGTYRMNNDIAKSALTPPEEPWNQTLGRWLQVPAIGLMTHEGNRAAGPLLGDNLNTQAIGRQHKYQDAERENVLKNAQNLTANVDSVIANQQKNRAAAKAEADARTNRENVADRYNLQGDQRTGYVLNDKFDPSVGNTELQKNWEVAKKQGFTGTLMEFKKAMESGGGGEPPSFRMKADGSQEYVPGGAHDPETIQRETEIRGRGRQFSPGDIDKLTKEGSDYQSVTRFGDTFDNNYSGYFYGTGAPSLLAGRLGMAGNDTKAAAQWWQDYDKYKNKVRNQQFGATLTPSEQAEWEKADISPDMDPGIIRNNLAIQKKLVDSAVKRKASALIQGKYDPDVIAEAYGMDFPSMGISTDVRGRGHSAEAAPNRTSVVEDPLGIR